MWWQNKTEDRVRHCGEERSEPASEKPLQKAPAARLWGVLVGYSQRLALLVDKFAAAPLSRRRSFLIGTSRRRIFQAVGASLSPRRPPSTLRPEASRRASEAHGRVDLLGDPEVTNDPEVLRKRVPADQGV